jgi:hypothetical protein
LTPSLSLARSLSLSLSLSTHTQLVRAEDARAPLLLDVRNFYESEVGLFAGVTPLY